MVILIREVSNTVPTVLNRKHLGLGTFYTRNMLVKYNQLSQMESTPSETFAKTEENNSNSALPAKNVKFVVLPTPVKSENDKKEYRVIRLENQLTVCMISDLYDSDEETDSEYETDSDEEGSIDDHEEGEIAAAALCVRVGSFNDPENFPGMAHLLEHLVSMGSEKFPEENDFDCFLKKKGGSHNANTDDTTTTFYFECYEQYLATGLDKFAQFFIAPLMKKESILREVEAIDSEFQIALPSDTYRREQLLASFAKGGSPVNKFTWGNSISLRDNVSEETLYKSVHEFRKCHYSAHRMTLAVQARLSMDALQSHVLNYFSDIPCNMSNDDDFNSFESVFDTSDFTRMYYVQSIDSMIEVNFTWEIPRQFNKYKSKAVEYVSWILQHEGKGSLFSYFQRRHWATNLTAECESNSTYTLLCVNVTLTNKGLTHLNEVTEVTFSYINMLREVGPQEYIYNEIKSVEDTSFRFQVEETPADYVEDLVEWMQCYSSQDYLSGSKLYFQYDPEAIKMVLNVLTPDKVNVMVSSHILPAGLIYDKVEKWFGTKYTCKEISSELIERYKNAKPLSEFSLPPPNQFLARNFTILKKDKDHPDYPEKIFSSNQYEMWYRKDQEFKLPMAHYNFYLISPIASRSPLMCNIYCDIVNFLLSGKIYPAIVAGLDCSIEKDNDGVIIRISGYNEKLPILTGLIADQLANLSSHFSEETFEIIKESASNKYYNNLLKTKALARDVRRKILINTYESGVDNLNRVDDITFDDVRQFSQEFLNKLYIKVLVQGNVSKKVAKKSVSKFVETLNCGAIASGEYPKKARCAQLPKGKTICRLQSFNKIDSNSVITNYYQCGPATVKNSCILEMITQLLEEPLFDSLRTKGQLGYRVFCKNRKTCGILGFRITVITQATKYSTDYIDTRIEEFLEVATQLLNNISVESFNEVKKDLIDTRESTHLDLEDEVDANWSNIVEGTFDKTDEEIKIIKQLKPTDIKKWWKKHMSPCHKNNNYRKLSIQVVGSSGNNDQNSNQINEGLENLALSPKLSWKFLNHESSNRECDVNKRFITNIDDFKRSLSLH